MIVFLKLQNGEMCIKTESLLSKLYWFKMIRLILKTTYCMNICKTSKMLRFRYVDPPCNQLSSNI